MKSKVIQITSTTNGVGELILFALCEDGSIWVKPVGNKWKEIKTDEISM